MSETIHRIRLHDAQAKFRAGTSLYRGFVGGRGTGKSWVGAYDLAIRATRPEGRGRRYSIIAPTYSMLQDSTLVSFEAVCRDLGVLVGVSYGRLNFNLIGGSLVMARSAENPERLRGPNISGMWMDEASLIEKEAYLVAIGCLRERGEQGWLSATFTPNGLSHWTYDVFGRGDNPHATLYHASTRDNPFLPAGFADVMATQYLDAYAEQEIEGRFVDLSGQIVNRAWFEIVDAVPSDARRVRGWDWAASMKETADYTAGARVARAGGVYYVEDIVRERCGPAGNEALVVNTALMDGIQTAVIVEREGGASGAYMAASMIDRLAGYQVQSARPTADKVTRAMPWLVQAQAGNIKLLRGAWNRAFLDEASAFPHGEHDDQIDAVSHAFAALASSGVQLSFGLSR